jgi:hypothetical protein
LSVGPSEYFPEDGMSSSYIEFRNNSLVPPVEELLVIALSDGPRSDFEIVNHSIIELTVTEIDIDVAPRT